jgi:hypothetical protein
MLSRAIKYKKWVTASLLLIIVMPMLLSASMLLCRQIIRYQIMEELGSGYYDHRF